MVYTTDAAFRSPTLLLELENAAVTIAIDFGMPGDANGDGGVHLDDFNSLKTNFGTGSKRSRGNFNGDQFVNLADFNILKANFASEGNLVPEPGAWRQAVVVIPALLVPRRRTLSR